MTRAPGSYCTVGGLSTGCVRVWTVTRGDLKIALALNAREPRSRPGNWQEQDRGTTDRTSLVRRAISLCSTKGVGFGRRFLCDNL